MQKIEEKIVQMLKSDDIEMVRLGATLLYNLPRKTWTPLLRECRGHNWYFIVNHNRISINEMVQEPTWIAGPTTSVQTNYPGTTVTYTNASYSMGYVVWETKDLSRDLDEEREQKRIRRDQFYRREKQKQHIYEQKWKERRLSKAFKRTGRNAFSGL